jgi:hypothetical protein
LSRTARLAHAATCLLGLALLLAAPPAQSQHLLYGRWLTPLNGTTATLVIITADSDGQIHGTLSYDPPQNGFAGAPFTTQIENGAFTIRLANGTRYEDLHWCSDTLCGKYYAPDDTATPVWFARAR